MTVNAMIFVIIAVGLMILGLMMFVKNRPRKLDVNKYTNRWKELQSNCATRKTWPLAIIEADNLLDDALRACNFRGKTTGERMVAAQHQLTSNDTAWFAHKLRNRIVHEDVRKIRKQDVFEALAGFRQALRDLGALK
ncbi:MAG: hypothetical protein JWO41_572 [Candidatus Saccharibacteria bacterium]|nr:hypothetical protein [Candidatus Saccharibacteria bacterium]